MPKDEKITRKRLALWDASVEQGFLYLIALHCSCKPMSDKDWGSIVCKGLQCT